MNWSGIVLPMDQKAFTIIFVVITLVAVGVLAFSRITGESPQVAASPSPSVDTSLFGNQNQAQQQGQVPVQQQNPAPAGQKKQYSKFPGVLAAAQLENKKAVIQTPKGVIEFEIYPDAPKAASNFIFLASDHFYDGLTFHRVEPGFVIQGGDPLGNGTGNPGYKFEDEAVTGSYDKGVVAMANAGPNTNGSQFFIMIDDHPELPKKYTIFGKVIKGREVVDKIAVGDVMQSVSIQPLK